MTLKKAIPIGLLVIELVREVPEAMKPKNVAIKTGVPLSAVEAPAADSAVGG